MANSTPSGFINLRLTELLPQDVSLNVLTTTSSHSMCQRQELFMFSSNVGGGNIKQIKHCPNVKLITKVKMCSQ